MVIFSEVKGWDKETILLKILERIDFKPDVIISTCSPIENHALAARLKGVSLALGLQNIEIRGRYQQCLYLTTHIPLVLQ